MENRIEKRFAKVKSENRSALVTFTMCGDPNFETSLEILKSLPKAGADIIELGMAFTDPMADGPAIQLAGNRALAAGACLKKTLEAVEIFRQDDQETPIILMGYFNPIFQYGVNAFMADAKAKGVDGLIIVDVPPEEDAECCLPAKKAGLDFIRLATPTTDNARLPQVLNHASGFIYYVSVAGVTGQKSAKLSDIDAALTRMREKTDLPIAVGFGIKTAEDVANMAQYADAVVVGSAIIDVIATAHHAEASMDEIVQKTAGFVGELANGLTGNHAKNKQVNG